jgi:hypothetical protein
MKKLLIFHTQSLFSANDLENYLYDTGATRDSYLDMEPVTQVSGKLKATHWHYSEWDIAGKDGEEGVDLWYMGWAGGEKFVFDDPYLMKLFAFEKAFRGPKAQCMSAIWKDYFTYATYRIDKELSAILSIVLADLLEHVDNETYTVDVAAAMGLSVDYLAEEDTPAKEKG